MIYKAYAKINIGLRVLNKRDDGFHNIETFFQQIDLYDDLEISATNDGRIHLTCSDEKCPTDESNLVYKAAALLKQSLDSPALGCRINIQKRIPMGGGLGGGSSNAATTLSALNKLWHANIPHTHLCKLALKIGSDVPFFLIGGFALGSGRGEILHPIDFKVPYYGLLYCPNISISTPWAYKNMNLNLTKSNKIGKFIDFVPELHLITRWTENLPNDLESVVFVKHNNFSEILDNFYAANAFYARMSGSGSTLFGLFKTLTLAKEAKISLAQKHKTILFAPL
jgi:4-diphosphocytidyl-2-C-methyl-D-erythritol kinase